MIYSEEYFSTLTLYYLYLIRNDHSYFCMSCRISFRNAAMSACVFPFSIVSSVYASSSNASTSMLLKFDMYLLYALVKVAVSVECLLMPQRGKWAR